MPISFKPCASSCDGVTLSNSRFCPSCVRNNTDKPLYFKFIYECFCGAWLNMQRMSKTGQDHTICKVKEANMHKGITINDGE